MIVTSEIRGIQKEVFNSLSDFTHIKWNTFLKNYFANILSIKQDFVHEICKSNLIVSYQMMCDGGAYNAYMVIILTSTEFYQICIAL